MSKKTCANISRRLILNRNVQRSKDFDLKVQDCLTVVADLVKTHETLLKKPPPMDKMDKFLL